MKKKKKIVLFIILIVVLLSQIWIAFLLTTEKPYYENFYGFTFRTAVADTVLSQEEMIKDVDYYISEIKTYHPQPFLFITEEEFDCKASEIKSELSKKDAMTVEDLYFKLSELVGMIDDSHTWVISPQNRKTHFLPFQAIYKDGKFYNISRENEIPYKAEILSINGIDSEHLFNMIAKFSVTPLKGGTENFVEYNFRSHVPLLLGFEDSYSIEYRENDKIYTEIIKPVKSYKGVHLELIDYHEYYYDGKSIPVLELNSFYAFDVVDHYKKKVAQFFKKYKDSESIVIDIRNNGGGSDDFGFLVFNYFADDSYKIFDRFIAPINDRVKAFYKYAYKLQLYINKVPSVFWNLPLYNVIPEMEYFKKILNAENGEHLTLDAYTVKNPIKKVNRYKGKVYLLISGNTASAAIDFASVFKYNCKNGIVVGQETRHPESFSGNISKYYLPYSGIGYTIPHTYCVAPGDENLTSGVIPDYKISVGIEDYDAGRDPELEFILSELEN
ncbi:MAG TPA: S41 family peptidase [Thermotogota bacterium]|nr:S41 family peptidase [Thermotogota bacterium]